MSGFSQITGPVDGNRFPDALSFQELFAELGKQANSPTPIFVDD